MTFDSSFATNSIYVLFKLSLYGLEIILFTLREGLSRSSALYTQTINKLSVSVLWFISSITYIKSYVSILNCHFIRIAELFFVTRIERIYNTVSKVKSNKVAIRNYCLYDENLLDMTEKARAESYFRLYIPNFLQFHFQLFYIVCGILKTRKMTELIWTAHCLIILILLFIKKFIDVVK